MKKSLMITLAILFLLATILYAGSGTSAYDKRWEIMVTDCQGNTAIYYSCALTNQGQDVVSFIPNAGRASDPHGPEIKVFLSNCSAVTMSEE